MWQAEAISNARRVYRWRARAGEGDVVGSPHWTASSRTSRLRRRRGRMTVLMCFSRPSARCVPHDICAEGMLRRRAPASSV